jgi:hypothetical protein
VRRRLLAVVLAALALALLVPTGSFSVAQIDRTVSVAVADDQRAAVSFWDPGGPSAEPPRYPGEDPVNGGEDVVRVLVVQHDFASTAADVRVSHRAGSPVAVDGRHAEVRSGMVVPVRASVDCREHTGRLAVPLVLEVVATDGSVEATIPVHASIVCNGPAPHETAGNATGSQNGTTTANGSVVLPR